MKVKIVDKKEDVKEMTIEELAERRFIGVRADQGKFLLVKTSGGYAFVGLDYHAGYLGSGPDTKKYKLDYLKWDHCTGHIFDTAKELYLWMAE